MRRQISGVLFKSVNVRDVLRILYETLTYSILRVCVHSTDALDINVEPYRAGVPYVAISHVWADGMGNPRANSLPVCHIAKVARLVDALETATQKDPASNDEIKRYRLWIDSLLCPVEAEGKNISLQRISDMCRNATHVLVFDSLLMQQAVNQLTPEDILLQIFRSSDWMRRLWTMQGGFIFTLTIALRDFANYSEGALAQSLYFQFADRAISLSQPLDAVYRKGLLDARYMRLWQDIFVEKIHLRDWFDVQSGLSSLTRLQRALHFRTVSNIADEPLGIATLLGLDQNKVIAISDAEQRMRCVWEMVANTLGGVVPARILFATDATLDISGWRWAQHSLLGTNDAAKQSPMDVFYRVTRFQPWQDLYSRAMINTQTFGQKNDGFMGMPTPWGLRVKTGGFTLHQRHFCPIFRGEMW